MGQGVNIGGSLTIAATVAASATVSLTNASSRITVTGAGGVNNGDVLSVGIGIFSVTNAGATLTTRNPLIVAGTTVTSGTLKTPPRLFVRYVLLQITVIARALARYHQPMWRIGLTACVALCACMGSMVRAPAHIPSDGVVECTDSMEMPITAAAAGVVSLGAAALYVAAADPQDALDSGAVLWVPLLGVFGFQALIGAAEGASHVHECRAAKQRGAEVAEAARRKAAARAEAGTEWKRAASAARADDCATVRELDPQIRELDVELHDVVFMRDVAIARCLASAR